MRSLRLFARVLVPVLVMLVAPAFPADAATRRPRGYRVAARAKLGPGLTHTMLRRGGSQPQIVHVARLARGSNLRLQPVPSKHLRTGRGRGLEPTSTMCRRVDCIIAVNGDFFAGGSPNGGVLVDGVPLKPPRSSRRQAIFSADRGLVTGTLRLTAAVVTSELGRLTVARVDQPPRKDELALMTGAGGTRTGVTSGLAADVRLVDPPGGLRVGQTTIGRIQGFRDARNAKIPARGVILIGKGKGAEQLRALAARIEEGDATRDLMIRLRSNHDAWDSVGGKPVIVRDGRSVVGRSRSSFVRARHPRTLLGTTKNGATLLVTVDGRRKGRSGMSLPEAARFMISLGAVEAINLDGGGSTTFVKRGRVVNRPSDGRERRVAVALAIVRPGEDRARPLQPSVRRLQLPVIEELPAPRARRDPAPPTPAFAGAVTGSPHRDGRVVPMMLLIPTVVGSLAIVVSRRRRRSAQPAPPP